MEHGAHEVSWPARAPHLTPHLLLGRRLPGNRAGGAAGAAETSPVLRPHKRSSCSAVRWRDFHVSFHTPRTRLPFLVNTHSWAGVLRLFITPCGGPFKAFTPVTMQTHAHTCAHYSHAGSTLDDSSFDYGLPHSRKGENGLSETVSLWLEGLPPGWASPPSGQRRGPSAPPPGGLISLPLTEPSLLKKKQHWKRGGGEGQIERKLSSGLTLPLLEEPQRSVRAVQSRAGETAEAHLLRRLLEPQDTSFVALLSPSVLNVKRHVETEGKRHAQRSRCKHCQRHGVLSRCSLCPPAHIPQGLGGCCQSMGSGGGGGGREVGEGGKTEEKEGRRRHWQQC